MRSGLADSVDALAAMPEVAECFRGMRSAKRWTQEQHIAICRIPAPTFREEARARYLHGLFRELGYSARIDDAGNVVAPLVVRRGQPFVALSAHMDTVLAPRKPEDIVQRADGQLEGPGVTDNGAGLAALVTLARQWKEGFPFGRCKRNVLFVANVAEEGEGNLHGMRYLCGSSNYAPKTAAYLVLDGASTAHITAEALGSRRFEVTIEGQGGHSWNDFGRANPVHALGRAIAILADVELPRAPRTTLSVSTIDGGSSINAISANARAKIDIRSRSDQAMEAMVGKVEHALKLAVEVENRRATDRLTAYRIREIGHRPAAALHAGNPVLASVQAADQKLKIDSRLDCSSTDANIPLSMNKAAAAIGVGGRGGGAHTPEEWFHPGGRQLGLQRVILAAGALLTAESLDLTS